MTTKITESVILTLASGEEIVVGNSEKVRPNNVTTVTCDGPRCAIHHNAIMPVTLVLEDEKLRLDTNAAPDAFARFIRTQPYALDEKTIVEFCSRRCQSDWFASEYVEPLSPRERAAQMANNEKVDRSRFNQEAVSQADGAVEDFNS